MMFGCNWQCDCLWPWNIVAGVVVNLCGRKKAWFPITDVKQGVHSGLVVCESLVGCTVRVE